MTRLTLKHVFFVLILAPIFLVNCVSPMGGTGLTGLGNSATTDGQTGGQVDGSDFVAIIPTPRNEDMVVTAPDGGGMSFATGANLSGGNQLVGVVGGGSISRLDSKSMFERWTYKASLAVSKIWNGALSQAMADDDFLMSGLADEINDPCNETGVFCADITDGVAELTLLGVDDLDDVAFYVRNKSTGTASEALTIKPNLNLVYTADLPAGEHSLTTSETGELYIVTDTGHLQNVRYDAESSRFNIGLGDDDHMNAYKLADFGSTSAAGGLVDDDGNFYLLGGDSIKSFGLDDLIGGRTSVVSTACDTGDGCSVSFAKVRSNNVYYSTRHSDVATSEAKILNFKDSAKDIQIDGSIAGHTENTLAFDVNMNGANWNQFLSIVKLDSGQKIYGKVSSVDHDTVSANFTLSHVKSIEIIQGQTLGAECDGDGKFIRGLAVVVGAEKVQFVKYSLFNYTVSDDPEEIGCNADENITAGFEVVKEIALKPVTATAINVDRNKVYTVHDDDDSVTVIDLDTQAITKNVELKSKFTVPANTNLKLRSVAIAKSEDGTGDEYLFVGQGLELKDGVKPGLLYTVKADQLLE